MKRRTFFFNSYSHREIIKPGFFTTLCLLCALGVICYPAASFQAAQRGLQTWWEIVVPSLLPFFIIAELLMNLGFVAFLGTLMDPAMRPLFNLPGSSGFILAVSYLSGFPLCAILCNKLRRENQCTKDEGERLLAFTSNASPLFMLGAISMAMYQNPALGPIIAGIHYLSNFICGLILKAFSSSQPFAAQKYHIMLEALRAFATSSHLRTKNFGQLLGETVRNATLTLLSVGGFITFFSVIVGIFQEAGIFNLLLNLFSPLMALFNIDAVLLQGIFIGFFEITIGIQMLSQSSSNLLAQILGIEALLAWNGLAIQAQIAGMLTDSDLRTRKYYLARLLQIPISMLITLLVFLLPLEDIFAVPTAAGTAISPLAWGGAVALLSIILFLGFGLGHTLLKIARKKIIIIR
ncbi:MAG: sporulation integral membrane protein YlbJ [Syntrophaceticus sp.]|jgi:sporulation integral membrane protein YlbJ|nr:sporulation integral membrane protein YlbJ [Syntrophaceticus sp.]MDD3314057.1 sporulation integral membrane protein YlbJ [Syntrophaceticus sp.]MDD4359576.1 sporulation integral membrane protein YlbJ [Syntrophaceticus sp.]MDD4782988.1 sporulation integral membrane protein YlbJ [Syntrophaceticus sp.]